MSETKKAGRSDVRSRSNKDWSAKKAGYSAYRFKTDKVFRRYARGDEDEKGHFISELKKDIEERLAEE